MSTLRIGIIGAGAIARTHAGVLKTLPGVEVAFVVGRRRERAEAFAAEVGATMVEDDTLIARSDAVLICCPGYAQADYVLRALAAGTPVLSEKPGAIALADAEKIARAAAEGPTYQLGLNRRFAPVYVRLAELVRGGFEVSSYTARIDRGELEVPDWVGDPALSGGFLYETGIHLIDQLLVLFGPVARLEARARRAVYGEPDNFTLLFEHENGVHGVMTSCGHASWMPPSEEIVLVGPGGKLRTADLTRLSQQRRGAEARHEDFADVPYPTRWGFSAQAERFVARLQGDGESGAEAGARELVSSVRIVDEIYRSAS